MDRPEELRQWFALALQDLTLADHAASTMHPTLIFVLTRQPSREEIIGDLVCEKLTEGA